MTFIRTQVRHWWVSRWLRDNPDRVPHASMVNENCLRPNGETGIGALPVLARGHPSPACTSLSAADPM